MHIELLALGFLATTARPDVLTVPIPAIVEPLLSDALNHVSSPGDVKLADGELTGQRDLLTELITVAIDETGEQVGLASTSLLRREGSTGELRDTTARLIALLDLLDALSVAS